MSIEFVELDEKIWDEPSVRRVGNVRGPLAQALLDGKTIFVEGDDSEKRLNGYYAIAHRYNYRMEVRKIERDGKIGRIARFIKREE